MRAGNGIMRNCCRIQCRGSCIIYCEDSSIIKAFRNIPGITLLNVSKLNVLKLAPGGHVGHFCIWTESAFCKLDDLYGTWHKAASLKSHYNLPMHKMLDIDLSRILEKSRDPKSPLSTMQEESSQGPEEESIEEPENHVEAKPVSKTLCLNTILRQAKNHKLWMDKAAETIEAKSDEKGVLGKKPVVGKKGKMAVGVKKQKKPVVGEKAAARRNQQLTRSLQKRNPVKKPGA
ncbi:60S ribosomal protein L4-like [Enhydra lutris kenyoni]|uniref:60S ribosomal protein L4-like n=1 Tax=Enhydra lutris kenyoni TaxID=391180 RepID=A0A2Y9IQZ9_ENHLU|nr:60S ribosomal protein L4-like [Enhydra lutris kenyoni]